MTYKKTVSIGISAYNEESNIKHLILSLLGQNNDNYDLFQIIVVSDGSTDGTVGEIMAIEDERIVLIVHKQRAGKAIRQNEIIKVFHGDILLVMDADVLPANNNFLQSIVQPFYSPAHVSLVSPNTSPLPAKNFFESVINFSNSLKYDLYVSVNQSDNIYLCHGRSIAYRDQFARELEFPATIGQDAYAYLTAKVKKYTFLYQPKAVLLYRSPQNLSDHLKQSVRFIQSRKSLAKYFSQATLDENYRLPVGKIIRSCLKYFISNPLYFIYYLGILAIASVMSVFVNFTYIRWTPSFSSKKLTD